jgi:hypothetical protein
MGPTWGVCYQWEGGGGGKRAWVSEYNIAQIQCAHVFT